MEDLELICFKIISQVGEAKSSYLQSMQCVKKGELEKAKEYMELGDKAFLLGHEAHAKLIQSEASGNPIHVTLLLMHAEDQLIAAETVKILVEEISELHLNK